MSLLFALCLLDTANAADRHVGSGQTYATVTAAVSAAGWNGLRMALLFLLVLVAAAAWQFGRLSAILDRLESR